MDKYAIIVAGGSGTRMGSALPKQFLLIGDKPVLWYSLTCFLDCYEDLSIILVLPPDHIETGRALVSGLPGRDRVFITAGGSTRFHSVQNGLVHVPFDAVVFVHDAVRCLVTPGLIRRCYDAALEYGNAIPAIPVTDSLRMALETGSRVIDRQWIRAVQTPQTFKSGLLKKAFLQDYVEAFTDEASVAERTGLSIHLVEGEATNIKITRPIDLVVAERVLAERQS